ncbi:MAG: helix-turn-helix domain-containing protein [Lachnospiraceae bacterium]|nr:helix-turn-helix domain-containing protein [Lachnospiraceae bacterium]
MAQYKKEEIQTIILQSAEELFAKKGYRNTTIADIAKNAGISVGNIYRYYKGKEQILEDVLPVQFVEELSRSTHDKLMTGKTDSIYKQSQNTDFKKVSEEFQRQLILNRYRMCILYRYPEGTPYENVQQTMLNKLVEFVLSQFSIERGVHEEKKELLLVIYEGYIQMTLNILMMDWEEEKILSALEELNAYHVRGLGIILDL